MQHLEVSGAVRPPYASLGVKGLSGPGRVVGISDWLRAGLSGDRIPVGTRFSKPVQTSPGAEPILLNNGYRVFPGGKERPCRDADPSPLLVPWSRKSRAIPLLPLWAVRPVQGLNACTKVHFTYLFYHILR